MATLTITVPDPTKDWIEARAKAQGFPTIDAYLGDLLERERADDTAEDWPDQPELTIEDLRRIVEESRASGIGNRSMADIISEGNSIAKARGFFRE
ncbi:ribbon-helix-helix domain-containing protein [Aureimonas leprariae]|uniref:Type II toxin-antitoxin system ParD family antitoxin n=1 Tax=Plantimonas leprariae TaxID=2615207 RepID=A0A7V7TXD3_9HYPH|nr:type II toxin-antitoxin system ParD family antitoxin [Aureimonas leprariae]KAB0680732.1 type II toxin-antitoxin system ParD family antitoxin [Aureimonas leprariae]